MSGIWRRVRRLYAGLVLFGLSLGLMVQARLGLGPWDVFHQGAADRLGISIGWVVNVVAVGVLVAWIPLGERPGLGTLSNVVVVGTVVNGALVVIPEPPALGWRALMLVAGVGLNAAATALYIGAGLGPGPRDGLMTGLARRGHSIRVARTAIEATVLLVGMLLGGAIGIGTLLYAAAIGPLTQAFMRTVPDQQRLRVRARPAGVSPCHACRRLSTVSHCGPHDHFGQWWPT